MSDHVFYDPEFFAEQERPKPLRKQVGEWIDHFCATSGKSHSFAWRRAYLELEDRRGFRGPDKNKLDAIEEAGLMAQLLEIVKSMSAPRKEDAGATTSGIPDYIPLMSDKSRRIVVMRASQVNTAIPDFIPCRER